MFVPLWNEKKFQPNYKTSRSGSFQVQNVQIMPNWQGLMRNATGATQQSKGFVRTNLKQQKLLKTIFLGVHSTKMSIHNGLTLIC